MSRNLEFAQAATLRPIVEVARTAGLNDDEFEPLGRFKAKLTREGIDRLWSAPGGKLVLVTAITPTIHGEGKTTVTVGLAQGLRRLGRTAVPALREPALGPIFGNKGGACGGGRSQVLPMEEINLFFNGDFPAIAAAHNLLSAMLDAHLHHGNDLGLDVRQPMWPRTVDMNDRALRQTLVGLGGTANGVPREDGTVVTPASEIMAILCLAESMADLKARLGRILVGRTRKREAITAAELGAVGSMAALLRDALRPNLVQTMEGGPAIVHGGPFANIAHGCSSVEGTRCALGLAEFAVTEAGFASDLGAQKFLSLVAPALGRGPDAIVLVATVRAIREHGAGDLAVGFGNVAHHLRHLRAYGVPVVVAINRFADDSAEDLAKVGLMCASAGVEAVVADPYLGGGEGCTDLASVVARRCTEDSSFRGILNPEMDLLTQMETIVREVYGGLGVQLSDAAEKQLAWLAARGLDRLPVCIAKTQYSFSDDPKGGGLPRDFVLQVRELRPSLGAGFVVVACGEMLLMPGLGKSPAALAIDVDDHGRISGMF